MGDSIDKDDFDIEWAKGLTYADVSRLVNRVVLDKHEEWAGLPMPLPGLKLTLDDRHPWRERMEEFQAIIDEDDDHSRLIDDGIDDAYVVNRWYSFTKRGMVYVLRDPETGQTSWTFGSDYALRNRFLLGPCETSVAWPIDAECKAMARLSTLISQHLFKMYVCTGQFLETSKRSGLTYLFRRLRPTVVLTANGCASDQFCDTHTPGMRILTTLCLHPLGYYANSYCGAMVPTDDVIAHLLHLRTDEHLFWRRSNHHPPYSVLSGL